MSKTQCDNKAYEAPVDAKFICKKCERRANKEEKLCKPKKLKTK
jgi:hypothetical protein